MNVVVLRGRMASDTELKTSQSGTQLVRFTLAVARRRGENETDFVRCVCFGKTAEFASQYIRKGDRVGIVGRIQVQQYEKDGEKKTDVSVVADQFDLIETKKESDGRANAPQSAPAPQMETIDGDESLPF